MIRTLELGGIVVPVQAAGDIDQSFETIGGVYLGRKMSGAAYKQRNWRALKTVISGSGWAPAALAGLDYDAPMLLKSVGARAIQAVGNVILVPAARRTDSGYAPIGFAVVAGRRIPTPLALVGDTATLSTVSGAQGYAVDYWPQFTVYAELRDTSRPREARWSWSIEAEEAL